MRFLHGKVKAFKGQTIEVSFSRPTRVLVMSQKNFEKYRNNLTFTYYGGQKEESPYNFSAPVSGEWYVVVEKGTYYEPIEIDASFKVVNSDKPEINQVSESDPEESEDSPVDDEETED